jgi:ATP-dependent Clp protease protease subunit
MEDLYNERGNKNKTTKTMNYNLIAENAYEELEHTLQLGVDLQDSIVYICGEIGETTLFDIIARVRAIQKYRETSDFKGDPKEPITFLINSPGGLMHDMLGIIDFMQSIDIPVNTICRGTAFSAAAVILACGTGTRACSARSNIMFHQSLNYHEGKFNDVEASIAYTKIMENQVHEVLAKNSNQKDISWWKEKMKTDYFLSAEDAIKLGVIDIIL